MSLRNLSYGHIHLKIHDSFVPSTLAPFIKQAIGAPISLSWSIEKHNKLGALHVHVMLIVDAKNVNPLSTFYKVRKSLEKLHGVNSASIFKRINEESIVHNIKKYDEYLDAIYRYSYHAKTDSKGDVPICFKRTFGSSLIKDKFYYIYEDIMIPKITAALKNDALDFIHANDINYTDVNLAYQACRSSTFCYHMQERQTSENIGFLGLYLETDRYENEVHLFVHVENVYLKEAFRGLGHSELFITHISPLIGSAISEELNKLQGGQKLIVMHTTNDLYADHDGFMAMLEDTMIFWCQLYSLELQ